VRASASWILELERKVFMSERQNMVLFFDGLCEPINPGGTPSYGWLLQTFDGTVLHEGMGIAPKEQPQTNNTAEWIACLEGIRFAKTLPLARLEIHGDSQLVIHQLNRKWQCKKPHLAKFRDECLTLLVGTDWVASWVPREENEHADKLSRQAYEEHTGRKT
jgi:ribonuclease HI